jgi:methionine-rich copper-binding protein CopC
MDFNNNGSFTDAGETIIAPFDITTSNGAVPTTLKFGFAASTGGSTDVHEIRNLIYETVDAPPTVTTFTPADNATTVAVAANFVVTFSEAVQKGTGNIVIKKVSDNSVVETIDVTSANVTVTGSSVTINPVADLAQSTDYYVEIAAGAIKDIAGNNYAGTTGATAWNFTTADTTPPTVSLTSAAAATVNAAFPVTATFSESTTNFIASDITVTNGTVSGFSGTGTTYNFTVTPTGSGTVTVNIPANIATDTAGNNNTAATALTRTADTTAPTAATFTPADNATNIAVIATAKAVKQLCFAQLPLHP